MTPEEFRRAAGVSRETLSRLERYADELVKWQSRINLVSDRSLDDLWRRHMLDSAQLARYVPPDARVITDLGSGAGFPGLVLAVILGRETHLIESDARKAAFLRAAARAATVSVSVHNARIEEVDPWPTDVLTARALTPLPKLLSYAERFAAAGGCPTCLFLKGSGVEQELTDSGKVWHMRLEAFVSDTDPSGRILRIRDVTKKR